ncbi:potassium/proton antiporter [Anaerosporobacter faecicola]|uniref:potassium/proton antiporter n=1 Tax=Anaerosporobacter faecicola TaxID=2718714 RepID=UPI001439A48C|nr:potassium/proton antiporter [Anaerosporobacter faecicola]
MAVFITIVALIILICVVLNKISSRLGIPTLLAFILLGMLLGTDGVFKIPFDDFHMAEQICSVALIFIMFYGGFGTKWSEARPVAGKAVLLSSLGVILTAFITGFFCYFILHIPFWESMLLGSVISSTDAASVFSILRSKRLNLRDHTASLLEVESGSNDPCSYMLTVIMLAVMNEKADGGEIILMIVAQIVLGVVFGAVVAYCAYLFLKHFHFATEGFDMIFVVSVALIAYALPSMLGGNGYLSTYLVGVILGNRPFHNKKALVHFFDGLTGLMQILVFFLLGLLAFPSQIPQVVLPAIAIALFLTIVARPISVALLLIPFHSSWKQQVIVSWAGLRGAASIVFAVMATINSANTSKDIFHIVFCIVLFSILIQGSLIPYVARKLDMIDNSDDVMKTFTDYADEVPIQYIQLQVKNGHPWINKKIQELSLPPDTLIVMLKRGGKNIIPRGQIILKDEDRIILTAAAPVDLDGISLMERKITKGDEWIGKLISEIGKEEKKLIIMIQRQERIIIPNGRTMIQEKDILVINGEES